MDEYSSPSRVCSGQGFPDRNARTIWWSLVENQFLENGWISVWNAQFYIVKGNSYGTTLNASVLLV